MHALELSVISTILPLIKQLKSATDVNNYEIW